MSFTTENIQTLKQKLKIEDIDKIFDGKDNNVLFHFPPNTPHALTTPQGLLKKPNATIEKNFGLRLDYSPLHWATYAHEDKWDKPMETILEMIKSPINEKKEDGIKSLAEVTCVENPHKAFIQADGIRLISSLLNEQNPVSNPLSVYALMTVLTHLLGKKWKNEVCKSLLQKENRDALFSVFQVEKWKNPLAMFFDGGRTHFAYREASLNKLQEIIKALEEYAENNSEIVKLPKFRSL